MDLICLPEVPFDPDAFLSRVKDLLQEKKSVVIAVSEGITTADGKYVFELAESDSETSAGAVDAFGHKQLSGVGKFLADLIAEKLAVKTRAIELNTLQRCAAYMTSRVDVTEAFQVGGAAVKAAFEGESGKVAVLTGQFFAVLCQMAPKHSQNSTGGLCQAARAIYLSPL